MEEKNVIDEIVENTIKQIDENPFGITDDEMQNQEIVEMQGGENSENTIE